MKPFVSLYLLFHLITGICLAQNATRQDSLGLPGDNLNLYAVLELFQKSETFEDFEKNLNAKKSKINNLDLNNDGKTDYIRVIDNKEGNNHAIVLQVPVNAKENQDVAVIELEKTGDNQYHVQIVGNEELYGKDYIIEPSENTTKDKSSSVPDNKDPLYEETYVYVAPAQWPIIVYAYQPAYVVYVSPWHWSYYPPYWHPWAPWHYDRYYGYYYRYQPYYYRHYRRTSVYRSPAAHGYYGPRRSTSPTVMQHKTQGTYQRSYRPANKRNNPAYRPRSSNPGGQNPGNTRPRMKSGNNTNPSPRSSRPRMDNNRQVSPPPSVPPSRPPGGNPGGVRPRMR